MNEFSREAFIPVLEIGRSVFMCQSVRSGVTNGLMREVSDVQNS
jgi:hypothetical protein